MPQLHVVGLAARAEDPEFLGRAAAAGAKGSSKQAVAAEHTIAAYEYTEAQRHDWASAIRSYQPVLLQGYASILAELAKFVIENRVSMPRTLLGVFSTAEVLYGWQRELMEQAFGCKVFNQYGSREIPNIACECRHGNQHVFTDMVYLESLDIDDEERLVITGIGNGRNQAFNQANTTIHSAKHQSAQVSRHVPPLPRPDAWYSTVTCGPTWCANAAPALPRPA